MQLLPSVLICGLLALNGILRKSLSFDGALLAFVMGVVIFSHPNLVFPLVLIVFYISSSFLTKVFLAHGRLVQSPKASWRKGTRLQVNVMVFRCCLMDL